jgi:CRP-like cAMP-binding protein
MPKLSSIPPVWPEESSNIEYRRSQKTYSQGVPATSVMYLQMGGVKLSVVNEVGKEAVVAILGPGDFFGEACLARDQTMRPYFAESYESIPPTVQYCTALADGPT